MAKNDRGHGSYKREEMRGDKYARENSARAKSQPKPKVQYLNLRADDQ